jgi:signal transduction histidine kinase
MDSSQEPQSALRRSRLAYLAARAASLRDRWFSGITRNGVLLVAAACGANAMRRLIVLPPAERWIGMAQIVAGTAVVLLVTLLGIVATVNRVGVGSRWRYTVLALAVPAWTAVGVSTRMLVFEGWTSWMAQMQESGGAGWWFYESMLRYGGMGILFCAVFVFYRIRQEHEAATRQAEIGRARSEQQMDEARLQMLQAQIEPHFLFNTLAHVRRLYQTDHDAGEAMLRNLMRYLAAALPQMRASHSTLGREVALTRSYLEIQCMRMGPRLRIDIDVPEVLEGVEMPPMMLITLAENAIKHGIQPLREGGQVQVSARVDHGELRLDVADTGQGFEGKTSGGGTGLANIRARLSGLYGAAGRLSLALNAPRGVVATIALPCPASETAS